MELSSEPYDYSVAIPAYGRHELVKEIVEKALSQKFPSDMKWEVIVNDDCTPIPLEEVLTEFKGRIRVERNERNLGFSGNWNKTLRLARAKWVHMLHSDDLVNPQFAPVMWELIHKAPVMIAFIHSRTRTEFVGRPIVARLYSWILGHREPEDDPGVPYSVYEQGPDAIRHTMRMGVRNTTVVVRRQAALSIEGFLDKYGNFSDEEYYVRLACQGDVLFAPRRLITYRYHGDQISHGDWLRKEFIDEYGRMHDATLAMLGEQLSGQDRAVINWRIAQISTGVALVQALNGDVATAQATLRKARERYKAVEETAEYHKAELIAGNRLARAVYGTFFM